jgi:hypothetical protein
MVQPMDKAVIFHFRIQKRPYASAGVSIVLNIKYRYKVFAVEKPNQMPIFFSANLNLDSVTLHWITKITTISRNAII